MAHELHERISTGDVNHVADVCIVHVVWKYDELVVTNQGAQISLNIFK